MKWTEEMNLFIIRSYCEITAGVGATSYRPLFHYRFVERFPQFALDYSQRHNSGHHQGVRLVVIVGTGDQESMGTKAAASITPRRTTDNNFSASQSTLLHRPAEVPAEVRDEFQRARIESSEVDLLHRPGIPRFYAPPATLGILSQISAVCLKNHAIPSETFVIEILDKPKQNLSAYTIGMESK